VHDLIADLIQGRLIVAVDDCLAKAGTAFKTDDSRPRHLDLVDAISQHGFGVHLPGSVPYVVSEYDVQIIPILV
jgi:hypothetical protein